MVRIRERRQDSRRQRRRPDSECQRTEPFEMGGVRSGRRGLRKPLYPGEGAEEMSAWAEEGYRIVPIADMLGTVNLGTDREGISDLSVVLNGAADPPVYNL